ncbi:MAG: hypothetical protein R3F59_28415 [Myxococcota bacterium]
MQISLARLDPRTHRLRVDRAQGEPIDVALETRSFLVHDLAHYAVEAEAPTEAGFWGLLAAGADLAALRDPDALPPGTWEALMAVEGAVVRVQTAFRRGGDLPGALAPALAHLRRLDGAWRKARQGDALVLSWPPGPSGPALRRAQAR